MAVNASDIWENFNRMSIHMDESVKNRYQKGFTNFQQKKSRHSKKKYSIHVKLSFPL